MIGRPHASMRAWQGVVDLQIPEPKIGTGALNARPHPRTPAQTRVHAQFATIGRVPALFCKQIERACPNVYAELGSEMAKLGLEMAELRSEMAKLGSEMAQSG